MRGNPLNFITVKKTGESLFERVEKVDTLLDGNAVRSKIKDFRTALYPRQYHPSALEKPLNKRFFKGTGVVLAGIECSQKSVIFANGIPVQECVDFSTRSNIGTCNF